MWLQVITLGRESAHRGSTTKGRGQMSFNPLEHRGIPLDDQLRNWRELNVEPIDPDDADPYTRCRIITMNGIEVESIMFSHQFARHCPDLEVSRQLAQVRYVEHQQQKVVNWLLPGQWRACLETTHRLRAGRRRPDRVGRPDGARPVPQAGVRVRGAGGLRPPLPLREPVRDDRAAQGREDRRRAHRGDAGPARRTTASPAPVRQRARALRPRTPSTRSRSCTR